MSPDTSYSNIFANAQRSTAPQSLATALETAKRGNANKNQIQKAAEEFESVFLGQMMQAMMPAEGDSSPLAGSSESDEIFNSMMGEEYAKQIAKSGGIGIAGFIERELLGQQEVNKDANKRNYTLSMLKLEDEPQSGTTANAQPEALTTATENSADSGTLLANSPTDALLNEIFQGGI